MSPTNSTKGTTDSVSDGRVTPETAVVDETSDAVATADERKELTNDVPEIQEASRALWTADEVVGSSSTSKVDTKADRNPKFADEETGNRETVLCKLLKRYKARPYYSTLVGCKS